VFSLIFSIFDYSSAVFMDLTGEQKLKLKRLINTCVRLIFILRKAEHVSHFYYTLSWFDFDDIRVYLICCLLFSILQSGTSSYLACILHSCFRPRDTLHASSHDLAFPSCRSSSFQQSSQYVAPSLWNFLSTILRVSESFSVLNGDSFVICFGPEPVNFIFTFILCESLAVEWFIILLLSLLFYWFFYSIIVKHFYYYLFIIIIIFCSLSFISTLRIL